MKFEETLRKLPLEGHRELHAKTDRAVLDAYGWTDIPTECEFLLDYEIEEATWGNKKKPWRYRWPDSVRDEVLARLLELNQQRHRAEQMAGPGTTTPAKSTCAAEKKKSAKKSPAKKASKTSAASTPKPPSPTALPLFTLEDD